MDVVEFKFKKWHFPPAVDNFEYICGQPYYIKWLRNMAMPWHRNVFYIKGPFWEDATRYW